jgi:diadenylate cyclase
MLEGLVRLFAARPFAQVVRDVVDILIVAYVIYRALLVMRGTRAMQMGIGLGFVFLLYLAAKTFHLTTLNTILSWVLGSVILIIVVVFQNDIRRALIRMGSRAWLGSGREQQSRVIEEVVAAATELARHRTGAIIAFEQDANVLEFCTNAGIEIESVVTRELLVCMFVPESVNKLHDGAVLIRDLKIARAGVFFPMLPETKVLDTSLGSRHRAALGITEETDAVVVVVSEERGTISCCFSGNIVLNLDGQALRTMLLGQFGRASRKKQPVATTRKPTGTTMPGNTTLSSMTPSRAPSAPPVRATSTSVIPSIIPPPTTPRIATPITTTRIGPASSAMPRATLSGETNSSATSTPRPIPTSSFVPKESSIPPPPASERSPTSNPSDRAPATLPGAAGTSRMNEDVPRPPPGEET